MAVKKRKKAAAKAKPVKKTKGKAKVKAQAKSKAVVMNKKAASVNKLFTKSEIMTDIAGGTGLSRKQVASVLESLHGLIERHLKKSGPGIFVLPGLLKCQVVHKPATKARKGINPFTGEPTIFKAKPARNLVKVKALKKLKEMVV